MSQILAFKEGRRIGSGRKSTTTLLTDQPDPRISILWLCSLLAAIVLGFASIYAPIENSVKFGLGIGALVFAIAFPVMLARNYFTLRLARYTVTNTYVEARTGIFDKTERRIRLAYVREITTKQTFFQSLFETRSIRVFATNGDSIELQNIKDGEQKRELIWELVNATSTDRPHHLI